MTKNLKTLSLMMVVLFALFFTPSAVKAVSSFAEPGTTMSNPINVTFGKQYCKTWLNRSDHLFCYNKINVKSPGILTMTFSKPDDSEGEYGRLVICVYDQNGNAIWDTDSWESVKSASPNYTYYVGLNKGTYYVTVTPGFTVRSGSIETYYNFSFKNNKYCGIEPNGTTGLATKLDFNTMYTSYFGSEGGDCDNNDFYKFYLTKNKKYELAIENFDKLESSITFYELYSANGTKDTLSSYKFQNIDSNGNRTYQFVAPSTGWYYFKIYKYSSIKQIPYKIGIYTEKTKISKCKISLESRVAYTGKYLKPSVKVKYGSTTLKNGTDYTVTYSNNKKIGVAKVTIKGKGNNYTGTVNKTFYIVPKKVKGLKAKTQTTSSITLSWSKSTGAAGYELYQYNSSKKKWQLVTRTSSNSYKVKKLKTGTTYQFKVRAYKSVSGKKYYSPYSSALKWSTKPVASKITSISSKSKKATMKWKKVSGVNGYEIYMSTSKNGKYSKVKTITKAKTVKYTKSSLKKNKKYYFKVRAYKTVNGKKIYSSFSSVKTIKIK